MQFFYWLMFLIVVVVAIFAIQNSAAPLITINFLIWKFETSLVYTILGSMVLGILLVFLFWIQRVIGASLRRKKLQQVNHSSSESASDGR